MNDTLRLLYYAGWTRKISALLLDVDKVTAISDVDLAQKQWELISQHLPVAFDKLIDIGSDKGFFSFKVADMYRHCRIVAIEPDDVSFNICDAMNNLLGYDGINVLHKKYDMTFSEKADVTFLLSVYSQWFVEMGSKKAFKLLEHAWDNTKKCMFFSMADSATSHSQIYVDGLKEFGENSEETKFQIFNMLSKLKNVKVEYLGSLYYWGGKYRKQGKDLRHIFKLTKVWQ